jgi:hypothetical protein
MCIYYNDTETLLPCVINTGQCTTIKLRKDCILFEGNNIDPNTQEVILIDLLQFETNEEASICFSEMMSAMTHIPCKIRFDVYNNI